MPKLPSQLPSLRQFMQKAKVLEQYRAFLRAAAGLEEPQRSHTRSHIKEEYRRHKSETDPGQVRTLMVEGARQLDQLRDLLSAVVVFPDGTEAPGGTASSQTAATAEDESPWASSSRPEAAGWPWAAPEPRQPVASARVPRTFIDR